MTLFTERFRKNGFFVLDAPEAALPPQRQRAMLSRLHDLAEDDSQFIIATRSPILMAYPNATLCECGERRIHPIAGEETGHDQVMHDFVANPQRMLKVLMERAD